MLQLRYRGVVVEHDLTTKIAMSSAGSPWRPPAHIRDIAEAIACVLAAPPPRDCLQSDL